MTFISKKTRLLTPHWLDECDPSYVYKVTRKRSEGRLKRHSSCDDLRAWALDEYLNYQYLLELVTDGEDTPFVGIVGRYVPVEELLKLMCGKGGLASVQGKTVGVLGQGKVSDSGGSVTAMAPDHMLKIVNAAMSKLEDIYSIVKDANEEDEGNGCSRDVDEPSSTMFRFSEKSSAANECFLREYNKTFKRITCLDQRLKKIQKRRERLSARSVSPIQKMCTSMSGMDVRELYNREESFQARSAQERIEKLIAERGRVLAERCQAMKYLNALKEKFDPSASVALGQQKRKLSFDVSSSDNCMYGLCGCTQQKTSDESCEKSEKRTTNDSNSTAPMITFKPCMESTRRLSFREVGIEYRMCNFDECVDSTGAVTSAESVPPTESQRTYSLANQSIPDRKFRSETTMTEVEQTLRSFEQRLSDMECLERQVEGLKRCATMARYFKKKWLESNARGKKQMAADRERVRQEMAELYEENNDLKKAMQKMAARSDKEQVELQALRRKKVEMEDEMAMMKKKIDEYHKSYKCQKEWIDRLENKVTMQREEIEKLMTHVMRLCRVKEKMGQERRESIRGTQRSRSYGPACKRSCPVTAPSSEEDINDHSPRQCCCSCSGGGGNRPKSECGRRAPVRVSESVTGYNKYSYRTEPYCN